MEVVELEPIEGVVAHKRIDGIDHFRLCDITGPAGQSWSHHDLGFEIGEIVRQQLPTEVSVKIETGRNRGWYVRDDRLPHVELLATDATVIRRAKSKKFAVINATRANTVSSDASNRLQNKGSFGTALWKIRYGLTEGAIWLSGYDLAIAVTDLRWRRKAIAAFNRFKRMHAIKRIYILGSNLGCVASHDLDLVLDAIRSGIILNEDRVEEVKKGLAEFEIRAIEARAIWPRSSADTNADDAKALDVLDQTEKADTDNDARSNAKRFLSIMENLNRSLETLQHENAGLRSDVRALQMQLDEVLSVIAGDKEPGPEPGIKPDPELETQTTSPVSTITPAPRRLTVSIDLPA